MLSRLHTFFESNFTYKGAVCPNTERWHLSWWQENVNGPLKEIYTGRKKIRYFFELSAKNRKKY